MKTTIDLADDLFTRARAAAERDGRTMRALVEEGLRLALEAREQRPSPAPFKINTFAGKGAKAGLSAEFEGAGWETIRGAIYGEPPSKPTSKRP